MHIKTGSWEVSTTVCESDGLCDPAVLEPQIRNRRLSPGSSSGGGGGGGGYVPESNSVYQQPRQALQENQQPRQALQGNQSPILRKPSPDGHTLIRKASPDGQSLLRKAHKGRSSRRVRKERRAEQRWVEDSLSLLKPPPAFPVQDSPAKLQPAVSYASKVKAGATTGCVEVLLQNQWGLSFISEARPVSEGPVTSVPLSTSTTPLDPSCSAEATPLDPSCTTEATPLDPSCSTEATPLDPSCLAEATPIRPLHSTKALNPSRPPEEDGEDNSKLLLSCRHLVEALNYHSQEWDALFRREKNDPRMVVWFEALQENTA